MQTIVGYDATENAIALVFRGSSNIKNWQLNAELTLVKWTNSDNCKDCYVHEGFQRIWTSVRPSVVDALDQLSTKYHGIKRVFITGHSLGGAMAYQAALTLENEYNWNVKNVYTFGAPRVGNEKFAATCYKEWTVKRITS